jgi:hypothetical protein
MLDHPADQDERRRELCTFLVRCWSDPGDDVLVAVKSFSIYQAAQDARFEHPQYDNYDPVCFFQNMPIPSSGAADEEGCPHQSIRLGS